MLTLLTMRSIIDWAEASLVPMQLAARFPDNLQISEEQPTLPPIPATLADRRAYIEALERSGSEAAPWMLRVCTSDDVDFRHCYLKALTNWDMYQKMCDLGWKLPQRDAAQLEAEQREAEEHEAMQGELVLLLREEAIAQFEAE